VTTTYNINYSPENKEMSLSYPPTINPVTTPADGLSQVVTGTKLAGTYVFYRNNKRDWIEASYGAGVSGASWYANIDLYSGENSIEVITSDSPTVLSSYSGQVTVTITLIVAAPEKWNVWNCFDEFGLLLNLPRIYGEKNKPYKARLADVYVNPADSTHQGLVNGISRELGIFADEIDIVALKDMLDPTSVQSLLNTDGNAVGTKLVGYADDVYDHNPIFWGTVISDESYWDSVDETTNGYSYLPHIWDPMASGIYDKWQTAGIGDQDDLWVDGPVEVWNEAIGANSWYLKIHSGYFYSPYPSGVFS
jgi:hypothetical protein